MPHLEDTNPPGANKLAGQPPGTDPANREITKHHFFHILKKKYPQAYRENLSLLQDEIWGKLTENAQASETHDNTSINIVTIENNKETYIEKLLEITGIERHHAAIIYEQIINGIETPGEILNTLSKQITGEPLASDQKNQITNIEKANIVFIELKNKYLRINTPTTTNTETITKNTGKIIIDAESINRAREHLNETSPEITKKIEIIKKTEIITNSDIASKVIDNLFKNLEPHYISDIEGTKNSREAFRKLRHDFVYKKSHVDTKEAKKIFLELTRVLTHSSKPRTSFSSMIQRERSIDDVYNLLDKGFCEKGDTIQEDTIQGTAKYKDSIIDAMIVLNLMQEDFITDNDMIKATFQKPGPGGTVAIGDNGTEIRTVKSIKKDQCSTFKEHQRSTLDFISESIRNVFSQKNHTPETNINNNSPTITPDVAAKKQLMIPRNETPNQQRPTESNNPPTTSAPPTLPKYGAPAAGA